VASLTLDGEAPFGTKQPELDFLGSVEPYASERINVFLPSATVSAYVGEAAALALCAQNGEAFCLATANFTLVDDDPASTPGASPSAPTTRAPRDPARRLPHDRRGLEIPRSLEPYRTRSDRTTCSGPSSRRATSRWEWPSSTAALG
jgi:hypothetical protein